MDPYKNNIFQGDVLTVLRDMPADCFQTVVTSPPYWGLRDYGVAGQLGLEKTPEEYVAKMVGVFREVRRVLKPDGVCFLNLGDSYASGKGTCHNPGGNTSSFNVHLKEQNVHPLDRGNKSTLAASGLKPKDLVGVPWRVAFALQADGWWLRQDIIWSKPNPMPESVRDRCTKAHEYIFMLTKSARYYYDADAIKEPCAESSYDRWYQDVENQAGSYRVPGKTNGKMKAVGGPRSHKGSQFHTGKTGQHQLGRSSASPRVTGNLPGRDDEGRACNKPGQEYRNKRSVWEIATQPFKEAHFATFPQKLVEPCILAGSRERDLVLDPFFGSGTVGVVAQRLGRYWCGIELNPAYCKMAAKRLAQTAL